MWKRRPRKSQGAKIKFKFSPFFAIGICLLLVALLAVGMLIKDLRKFLYATPIFNVSNVRLTIDGREANQVMRASYGGFPKVSSNLLEVDLSAYRSKLVKAHPEAKSITVSKALPNELAVEVVNRRPIAQLKAGRFYPIDKDGVILLEISQVPVKGLPIIRGGAQPGGILDVGRRVKSRNIDQAFLLLRELTSSGLLNRLLEIDCVDASNLAFLFDNGIEVRVGEGDYSQRLKKLKGVLAKIKDPSGVEYIDLRFRDVVIGPK